MVKYRNITVNNPRDAAQRPARVCDGGLNASSIDGAIRTLNTIKSTELGTPGGIPILNEEGKVKLTDLTHESFIVTHLNGAARVTPGGTTMLIINNYDSFLNYDCSVSAGTLERNGKELNISIPEGYEEETVTLTINGFIIDLYVNLPIVNRPLILNLNDGDVIKRTDTLQLSEFSVSYGKGNEQHASTNVQIATDSKFKNIVVNDKNYTTSRTSYQLHGLQIETSYYIRVSYNSTTGIKNQWSEPVLFTTRSMYIKEPRIVSPANNDNGVYPFELNLSTEAFTVVDGTDTHVSSTWQIATDTSFSLSSIVASSIESTTNKTTWRVTTLLPNMTYYVRVKFKGDKLGETNWSSINTFSTPAYRTDGTGRRFLRHSSGMGTIMTWKDRNNVVHNTVVLDAPYRKLLYWGSSRTDVSGLDNITTTYYINPSNYSTFHSGTKEALEPVFKTMTDAFINGISNYREDSHSSNHNTTQMVNTFGTGVSYAPGYVRSVRVGNRTCDLPNIQTLIRIYCSQFILDEMDPTANGNRFLFSKQRSTNSYNWYFNNSQAYAWSSTEYNANYVQLINYQGYVHYHSGSFYKNSYQFAVLPIFEE